MTDSAPTPDTDGARLRIGLLVDSSSASKYVRELAEWAGSQGDISVSHLIVQHIPARPKGRFGRLVALLRRLGLARVLREVAFKAITELEFLLLRRSKIHRDHLRAFDLTRLVPGSLHVTPIVSKSGFVFRYGDDDIRAIKALNLDLLLRCGSGILRGEILNAARFGILSFHHADNRINRGGPAGFWEVFFRQDSTGFVIQQLTEELDGGNVLFRGSFATRYYYLLNQAALCHRSNFYLMALLKDIAKHRRLPEFEPPAPYSGPLFQVPTLLEQIRYLAGTASAIMDKIGGKVFGAHRRRWQVAYEKGNWNALVMRRGRRIENPPGRFLADPFVIRENGADYCFVEDCDLKTAKGHISVYRLRDDGASPLGAAVVEPFHLSFPFLFRFGSKLYMCPESSEAREIRLYECVAFPLQWKLASIVMSNVAAADSMIFEHDGCWWLFTNIEPATGGDYCSQLSIFYADSPLSTTWEPHPRNPIFVDSNRARNGGLLFGDRAIYRVAQRQGFNTYGKGISINKIVALSRNDYREEPICSIEPDFFADISATHHMSSNGHVTAFDFFGREFGRG